MLLLQFQIYDVSDIDENIISPRIALIHELNDKNIIKAQQAKAFLIPLYYSLYSSNPFINGNPDLEIDKAHTYELSHIYKDFTQSLKSTLYYVDMYSVDTFIVNASTEVVQNNSKQSAGLEVEYNQKFDSFDLITNMPIR